MKTVTCVDPTKHAVKRGQVTLGKEYKVIKELKNAYIIIDNFGVKPSVSKKMFKEVVEV